MSRCDSYMEKWKVMLKDFTLDCHIEGVVKLTSSSTDLEEYIACWLGEYPYLEHLNGEDLFGDRISD